MEKGLLECRQLRIGSQAFDGDDGGVSRLQRGDKTAVHEKAIHEDGARAALAFAATFFCARQSELMAQQVEQALHRVGMQSVQFGIDGESDFGLWHRVHRPFTVAGLIPNAG